MKKSDAMRAKVETKATTPASDAAPKPGETHADAGRRINNRKKSREANGARAAHPVKPHADAVTGDAALRRRERAGKLGGAGPS